MRRLLSGSVHAYRVSPPPACYMRFTRCCGELRWHLQPHVVSLFHFLHRILLLQDVKTYFCSPLCRYAMPTPTPILRSASPPLSLTSLPVLSATSLQQDVCRRLILGYNRWYLFFIPFSTHSVPFLPNVMSILLTFAEILCGGRVIFLFIPEGLRNYFSEFGKVDACTIVRDADGKSRGFAFLTFEDPASVNAVMVREHFLDGKAVRVACPLERHRTLLTKTTRFPHRSTLSARSHARSTSETRDISSGAWPRRPRRILCVSSFPNSERSSTPPLWSTAKPAGRRDSALLPLRITATTLSLLASWDSFSMTNRYARVLCDVLVDLRSSFFPPLLRLKSRRPNHAANAISNEVMQAHKTAVSTPVKLRQVLLRRWAPVCHL